MLKKPEETSDGFAPGRKNGQADHDKQNPLQKRKEKPNDSDQDKKPSKDDQGDIPKFAHIHELHDKDK